ncbi:MAG: autotransporter translocation and assembly factor TamB [Cyclobacteriaceae bacterium]
MTRRWWSYGLLGVCVLLVGACCLVISTERGSIWLVSQLQSEQFNVAGMRGSLLDEMYIDTLHLQTSTMQVDLRGVRLRVNFSRLLLSRLEISHIHVTDALVIRRAVVATASDASDFSGIPLRLSFPDISVQQFRYQQDGRETSVTAIRLAGSVFDKTLELTAFAGTYADYTLRGDVHMSLQAPWIFSGHYRLLAPQGEVLGEVYGDQQAVSSSGQVLGLTFLAELQLGEPEPALVLKVSAPRLEAGDFIPGVAGLEGLALASLDMTVMTDFSRFDVTGTAELVSQWLPTLPLVLDASYAESKLALAKLSLATGNGRVDLSGVYALPERSFAGELAVVDFPLAYLAAYIPAAVTGEISTSGQVLLVGQHLTLTLPSLTGEVNQRHLSGSMNLAGSQLDDLVMTVRASLARNQLVAALNMPAQELQLDFTGQELAVILPGARGTLALHAIIRQWQKNPWVEVRVAAQDLAVSDWALGNLTAAATSVTKKTAVGRAATVTTAAAEYHIQLAAENVSWRDQPLGTLRGSLRGDLAAQQGSLDWQRDTQMFSSQFAHRLLTPWGVRGSQPFQAALTLTNSELTLPWGKWLSKTLGVEYSDEPQVSLLAPSCWQSESLGEWCVDSGNFTNGRFQLGAHMSHLPVNLANLPGVPILALVGDLAASVNLAGDLAAWRGEVTYQMPGSLLSWSESAEDQAVLDIGGQGTIDTFAALVDLQARSGQDHQLNARLSLADLRQPENLQVSSALVSKDLGLLTALLPFVAEGQGQAQATVDYRQSSAGVMAGELQRKLTGQVNLGPGVSGLIPALNLRFSDLALEVSAPTERDIQFRGNATSGNGQITLVGEGAQLFSPSRELTASLKGSQFTLVNRPELRVVVSPDLAVAIEGQQIKLTGSLRLDNGQIEEKALKVNTRGRSQDVVLATDETRKVAKQAYELDLNLIVGDQVRIVLYGLNAGVSGALRIRQSATRVLHVEGTLNLTEGVFSRYGVEFQLERGRLVYNGALANPTVDVIARREIDSPTGKVVVRLVMTGAATDIQSRLVATPAMSEADALSYLLLGRPLRGSSGSDGSMLANAALSFGLKKAVPITAEIQSTLGLDELSVGGKSVDSAAIVAGKRLSKNLYMEYNYGIFSRIGGLLLNYQLTEQLSLQAQSGTADSLDLIYTF